MTPADPERALGPAFRRVLALVAVLWVVWALDQILGLGLRHLGVLPRELRGLVGVPLAPLIHGSFSHIFANTPTLLVLGTALLWGYPRSAAAAAVLIVLGSGLGTWLFGRLALHFGASGLTHGVMVFLFVAGILRRDPLAIVISLLTFFLYGSMIWGVFPREPGVSFEIHLFGALSGLVAAFVLHRVDPPPPRKRYSWEEEDDPGDGGWPPADGPGLR